jgi:hypothetical protein
MIIWVSRVDVDRCAARACPWPLVTQPLLLTLNALLFTYRTCAQCGAGAGARAQQAGAGRSHHAACLGAAQPRRRGSSCGARPAQRRARAMCDPQRPGGVPGVSVTGRPQPRSPVRPPPDDRWDQVVSSTGAGAGGDDDGSAKMWKGRGISASSYYDRSHYLRPCWTVE